MHVYMRHGNDEKKSTFKQDNSLNSSYEDDILEKTKLLINLYGYPKKIYCSPFRRARETVHIMKNILDVEIIIDPKLSRFFSKEEKLNPSVRAKTLKYNPPINETGPEFKKRVNKIEKKINNESCVVWVVTHYLVIKNVCKKYNKEIPKKMPFLYHVII